MVEQSGTSLLILYSQLLRQAFAYSLGAMHSCVQFAQASPTRCRGGFFSRRANASPQLKTGDGDAA
jgi:hypothetical protein